MANYYLFLHPTHPPPPVITTLFSCPWILSLFFLFCSTVILTHTPAPELFVCSLWVCGSVSILLVSPVYSLNSTYEWNLLPLSLQYDRANLCGHLSTSAWVTFSRRMLVVEMVLRLCSPKTSALLVFGTR